jgi:hypothetical protein
MKNFTTEFDVTVLSSAQQTWLFERAGNHHFDTVMLDKINSEGAWISILYDDGVTIKFFVTPEGVPSLLDVA